MRTQVKNQLTMLGKPVVAELDPSVGKFRHWIVLQPSLDGFVMIDFEHRRDLNTDGYPAPDDLLNRREVVFSTLDDLLAELERRGIDSDRFDVPWKVDYPL